MSTATGRREIGFITRGGSYTARIVCNKGDFFQEYDDVGNIYPNYAEMSPKCRLWLIVDTSLGGLNTPLIDQHLGIEVNGAQLSFGADGVDTTYGMFKRVAANSNGGTPAIEVVGNPATAFGQASFTFRLTGNAYVDGVSFAVGATSTCSIRKGSGAGIIATIYEAPAENGYEPCGFNITRKGQIVKLKCRAGGFGTETLDNAYYRWLYQDPLAEGGWTEKQPKRAQDWVDVSEGEVNGYLCVKCEVYAKAGDADPIAQDQQGIWDSQDPKVVQAGADTDDLVFYDGDTAKKITFLPYVTEQDGTLDPDFKWYAFSVIDSAGNIMNDNSVIYKIEHNVTTAGFPVTYDYFEQNRGPVDLVITAYDYDPSAT